MDKYDVKYFEDSVSLTEELYNYLEKNLNVKIKKQYTLSYAKQFGFSELGTANINLALKGIKNASVSILAMMIGKTENPFILSLWTFNGEHKFKDIRLDYKQAKDKELLLSYIKEFFNLKDRYEQLTLF